MLLKITLDTQQLEALHRCLSEDWNKYPFHNTQGEFQRHESFVIIKSSTGQGDTYNPVPKYNVTLEVKEEYQGYHSSEKKTEQYYPEKVPRDIVNMVFKAIKLYPK